MTCLSLRIQCNLVQYHIKSSIYLMCTLMFYFGPMSYLLTWRGRGLWPILQPATKGLFQSCHVVHLYICQWWQLKSRSCCDRMYGTLLKVGQLKTSWLMLRLCRQPTNTTWKNTIDNVTVPVSVFYESTTRSSIISLKTTRGDMRFFSSEQLKRECDICA